MKVILRASLLIMIAGLFGKCSFNTNDSNSLSSSNSDSATSPSKASHNDEGLPNIPYEEMLREIAGLSKQAGIINLREANLLDSETEIRIWKAFGIVMPRCLILKLQENSSTAFLLGPKDGRGKAVRDKQGEVVYGQTPLSSPRSGWEEVIRYLKEEGIDSTVKLAVDERVMPEPDAEELIIEVKTGSQYSMVHYIEFTESQDGKKAISICRRIESEFGKKIGCGS